MLELIEVVRLDSFRNRIGRFRLTNDRQVGDVQDTAVIAEEVIDGITLEEFVQRFRWFGSLKQPEFIEVFERLHLFVVRENSVEPSPKLPLSNLTCRRTRRTPALVPEVNDFKKCSF